MKIFRKLNKNFNYQKIEKNSLFVSADEFLKHYTNLYNQYWKTRLDIDEDNLIGALFEAEYIGRKFFGIAQESFELVKWRIERNN